MNPTSADPIVDWAESGVVALTGRRDGPPLVPPGRAATLARDVMHAIAAATAGTAQPVRLDGAHLLGERAAYAGFRRAGEVSVGGGCRLLPTADGWAAVSLTRPDDRLLLGALVGADLPAEPWPAVAAWLRAHDGEELVERVTLLGIAAGTLRPRPPSTGLVAPWSIRPRRDLAGALVVDFGALWAGPLCAHVLGLSGARVVKVETPDRPDGARRSHPDFYRLLHAGHRSVVLDPGTRGGRRALAGLVEAADVVVEASRPRALAGFGLDAEAAAAAGTTWVSITAYGRAANRVGFGDDVAAAAGLVARDASGPMFCGDALADPLTGLVAAGLAMSAPPAGALLEVSMADVVAATLTPGVAAAPSPAARRDGDGWVVDTAAGTVPVAPPRRREVTGAAPEPGADTAAVLRELGVPRP